MVLELFEVGIEPLTVQVAAKPVSDQIQACIHGFRCRAVCNHDDLRSLRAALHHDLQVTRQPQVCAIRVAAQPGLDQGAAHDGSNPVDQGVLNTAVGNVNDPVGAQFKQTDLGRVQAAADGEARTQAKSGSLPGHNRDCGQPMGPGQLIEQTAGHCSNSLLTEPRTPRARRSMRARRQFLIYRGIAPGGSFMSERVFAMRAQS